MDFRIEEKQGFNVLAMTRLFDEQTSSTEIPEFWKDFMAKGFSEYVCGTYGICHSFEQGKFRYSIADAYVSGTPVPEGFEVLEIPALTWAMFTCVGPMPMAIQATWQKVYGEWLPSSNYTVIPGYDIEMYTPGDVNDAAYRSEIWIPVKVKSL